MSLCNQNKIIYILKFSLIILGIFFLIHSYLKADDEYLYAKRTLTYSARDHQPSREKISEWQKDYDFHLKEGIRCYNEAKEKCWYLPDISERDKARYCFTTAVASIGNHTPCFRLVSMVTTLLLQYSLDSMSEWNSIQNKLYWSSYHFELCDHYYNLIHKNILK